MIRRFVTELIPHWQNSELVHISTCFSSIAEHNSAFFLLAAEESRESLLDEHGIDEDGDQNNGRQGNSSWRECEVTGIISESDYGGLPRASSDARVGSVWTVSLSIRQPLEGEGATGQTALIGGDLVILHR